MLEAWDSLLTARMEAHGLERVAGEKERQMGGVDIHTYKRTMAALSETRSEVEKARVEVAEKSAERDAISVQIDQMTARQVEEGAKLCALQDEVTEKRALAGDLKTEILVKTAEKVRISDQIADFSQKAESAERRLESVQGELGEVESIAQASLPELAKRAASAGAGERECAARSQNQALRARLAALEEEKRGLEDENRGLRGRLEGLERRLDDLWARLVDAAETVKDFVFEQVGALKWVFDELGLESHEGMQPLAGRGYDLASESRDMRAASNELGRSWEPPAPSFHHGR